jgi:hypothetical protein
MANIVWVVWDTRPAFWDMASHQTGALRILDAVAARGAMGLTALPDATGFYPPLFHTVTAVFYALFGVSDDAARLANLPATAILMGSTYCIGRRLATPLAGAVAAMLVAFYPLMVWLSREPLLDYWLVALVALAFAVLLESGGFENRRLSILFGVVCGFGMLTKWTFAVFLALPALWLARRHVENAALAVALAAAVASPWYIPQLETLPTFLELSRGGAAAEGDPSRISLQAAVFYLRALVSYQLFVPLAILFAAGLAIGLQRRPRGWTPLWLWLAGSWVMLMFFENKDPRYSAPLLPAVAVVSGAVISRIGEAAGPRAAGWTTAALAVLLAFQHYAISFGTRWIPEQVVLAEGAGDALHRDWILYSQSYLGLWGPPAREEWMIDHVLDRVAGDPTGRPPGPIRIGMIPDIPRFDWLAFEFRIAARRNPVTMHRLNVLAPEEILANDYILLSENAHGYPGLVPPEAEAISRYVAEGSESFVLLEAFPIPSGDVIRLYRVRAADGSVE